MIEEQVIQWQLVWMRSKYIYYLQHKLPIDFRIIYYTYLGLLKILISVWSSVYSNMTYSKVISDIS